MKSIAKAQTLLLSLVMAAVTAGAHAQAAASSKAAKAAVPNIAGDWTYYGGNGKVTIQQQGKHVTIEATWLPNGAPPPHYRTEADISGSSLDGEWKCFVSPCTGEHGKWHADIAPGATRILVSQSEDPGGRNQINGVVMVPAPRDAGAMARKLAMSGVVEVYTILFDTDQAVIKPESRATIDEIAKLLAADPKLRLEVAGHTDNTGTPAHNLTLSQQRADAVVKALVTEHAIAPARLQAKGYGDTKPIAPNDTDSNRANNRRVELRKR